MIRVTGDSVERIPVRKYWLATPIRPGNTYSNTLTDTINGGEPTKLEKKRTEISKGSFTIQVKPNFTKTQNAYWLMEKFIQYLMNKTRLAAFCYSFITLDLPLLFRKQLLDHPCKK